MINVEKISAIYNQKTIIDKKYQILINNVDQNKLLFESSNKRKMSKAAIMAAICAKNCIKNNLIEPSNTAIICATQNGEIEYIEKFYHAVLDDGARFAPAIYFPNTVMNSIAGFVSIETSVTGENHTFSGRSLSFLEALEYAEILLATYKNVIVVASDEISEVIKKGYDDIGLLKKTPQDQGFIYAEGAAAFLLSSKKNSKIKLKNISSQYNSFSNKKYDNIISCSNGSDLWEKNINKWINNIYYDKLLTPLKDLGEFFAASPAIAIKTTIKCKGNNLLIGCDLNNKIMGVEIINE